MIMNEYHLWPDKITYYKLIYNDKDVPVWKLADSDKEDGYAMIFNAGGHSLQEAVEKFNNWIKEEKKQ